MDFARRQLEKYGWKDGKGLGKNENGILQPIKPKLKRSVTGIGHDVASEFTEDWWTTLYNKAAENVQVKEKNGKTKKIKINTDDFVITNSTWKLNKKANQDESLGQYHENFVKKAVLTSGGSKIEKIEKSNELNDDSDSDEEKPNKSVIKMTDEELFAACGGRTAHKGARHGLKALGKLARIEQQEQQLLIQPQYEGYSHAKKITETLENSVDSVNLENHSETHRTKSKKKKRKQTFSLCEDINIHKPNSESPDHQMREKLEPNNSEVKTSAEDSSGNNNINNPSKAKKSKKESTNKVSSSVYTEENIEEFKINKKKKKRKKLE